MIGRLLLLAGPVKTVSDRDNPVCPWGAWLLPPRRAPSPGRTRAPGRLARTRQRGAVPDCVKSRLSGMTPMGTLELDPRVNIHDYFTAAIGGTERRK